MAENRESPTFASTPGFELEETEAATANGPQHGAPSSVATLLDQLVGEHPDAATRVAQLRELLGLQNAREAALAALNEAARDLTKIRDLNHALQAVTDRTRRLLACDVAYLSARTVDDDHFEVRAWAGQLSPAFLGTRVSVGSGVGGQVASRRRPFQVANYLETDEFEHSDYLDRAVSAEGLVALLGVPLEVDGRLLGILFAGRRHSESFSDQHVELMSSLAAHAAVALDNAQLFISQLEALDELEKSTALLRAHTTAVETAAEVHGHLTEALLRGEGIPHIIEVVGGALGASVAMIDEAGRSIATFGTSPPSPPFALEVNKGLDASRAAGRAVAVDTFEGQRWYVSAATTGQRFLGALVLTVGHELSDVDRRTLERATQTISVSLLADAAAAEAEVRASGETMRLLLNERHSRYEDVVRLARRHGLNGPKISVVASDAVTERLAIQVSACAKLCRSGGGLAAFVDGVVITLSPMDVSEVAPRIWEAVKSATGQAVTLAGTAGLVGDLPGCHREAMQTLHLMKRIGREGTWAHSAEFGAYSLLLTAEATFSLDLLIRRTVGPLIDYDLRQHTELWPTALAFLDHSCNATATAQELDVHVNTVTQRLSRVDRLLGSEWRSGPRQLDVHNSLRLHQLRVQDPGLSH